MGILVWVAKVAGFGLGLGAGQSIVYLRSFLVVRL
jgi:hypothetical protein